MTVSQTTISSTIQLVITAVVATIIAVSAMLLVHRSHDGPRFVIVAGAQGVVYRLDTEVGEVCAFIVNKSLGCADVGIGAPLKRPFSPPPDSTLR